MTNIEQYENLWNGSEGWVLVRAQESSTDDYIIFNKHTSMMLHVEDGETQKRLCCEMLQRGIEVLDEFPTREFNLDDLP